MLNSKQELRARIRQQKQAMVTEEIESKSAELCRLAAQTEVWKEASTIYGYFPFNQEIRLLPLLQQALAEGKQVALPKCYGKEMRFILVSDLSRVQASTFGVPEPMDDSPVARDETALVLVPGLAFDAHGYRVGYGGGYYDRFFTCEPHHPTIGLCFDFQLVADLEPESHDIPVDTVFAR